MLEHKSIGYDAPIDSLYIPTMTKLSRKAIVDGLQSVPLDLVLLGAAGAKKTKLTAKQRAFAEGIAMGKTKAGAYRDAYGSKGKPQTASRRGQELAQHGAIAAQIDALRLAAEARKYATPAALRSLVIERLTAHAIDQDINPAQRLRALELLGKITEVAAFTERREIIKSTDAGSARTALLESLRAALRAGAVDAELIPARGAHLSTSGQIEAAADVQAADPGRADACQDADPTAPPPPDAPQRTAQPLLSIPHIQSTPLSVPTQPTHPTGICTPCTDEDLSVHGFTDATPPSKIWDVV